MKVIKLAISVAILFESACASVGDRLIDFQSCVQQCITFIEADFKNPRFDIYSPLRALWSLEKNCNYKCQQLITDIRLSRDEPMVQFYGKWPFIRMFGIQEFYSTIFSIANFYVNYKNFYKVLLQVRKNKKENGGIGNTNVYAVMLGQFLNLIIVSLIGWTFSTIFHIYDNNITETLDYFGASAIIITSFNCVFIRYFALFKRPVALRIWQLMMLTIYIIHCLRLYLHWDYDYNTNFNLVIGIFTILLWVFHSFSNYRQFKRRYIIYNNSIQLLPFETKIIKRINMSVRLIPLLPVFLNGWMILGMLFEIFEFTPWHRLIDGHSLWHLFTIFPPIIWYDWNIWDIEMLKITDK
ncbi:Per1-like protein, partial [Scheffersomyces coipomensis]|uniref:Per1-like protein n=1 Tax=Scheffersomyces coipomensis TaxID=1788519 RepID=UPI00315C9093